MKKVVGLKLRILLAGCAMALGLGISATAAAMPPSCHCGIYCAEGNLLACAKCWQNCP
ncbi:MAG: hypothetical protein ABIS07_17645 [Dokdonella sp.]